MTGYSVQKRDGCDNVIVSRCDALLFGLLASVSTISQKEHKRRYEEILKRERKACCGRSSIVGLDLHSAEIEGQDKQTTREEDDWVAGRGRKEGFNNKGLEGNKAAAQSAKG